jgi:hypothetical protein
LDTFVTLALTLELDAALLEGLLGGLGDLFVLHRHDAINRLDDSHLRAQSAVEAGELQADGARADDDEGLGQLLGRQGLAIGPDLVAVGFQADLRQGAGAGADGQHDRLGLDRPAEPPAFRSTTTLGVPAAPSQASRRPR